MRRANIWAYVAVCVMAMPTAIVTAQSGTIRNAEYTVPPGTVQQVPAGNSAILVERFTMGDKSRIDISDETPLLVIRAKKAVIGNDTMIFGRGRNGDDGTAGTGEGGQAGKKGPTIVLLAEEQNIQGLSIVAVGGSGGNGGSGSPGFPGQEAKCSSRDAGNGGPGGPGGDGGDGGGGGNIFVVLPRDTSGYGLSLNVNWGEPGEGGQGGVGGPGGRGKNRCGIWPYWKKGAGSSGPAGPNGSLGEHSHRGMFRTYHIEDFEPGTIIDQLNDIISLLNNSGYAGDAEALRTVLEAGVLTGS